jgi:hypothetical protein
MLQRGGDGAAHALESGHACGQKVVKNGQTSVKYRSNSGRTAVKQWSMACCNAAATEQLMPSNNAVKHRSNSGQTLVKQRSNSGQNSGQTAVKQSPAAARWRRSSSCLGSGKKLVKKWSKRSQTAVKKWSMARCSAVATEQLMPSNNAVKQRSNSDQTLVKQRSNSGQNSGQTAVKQSPVAARWRRSSSCPRKW